ncbi:unnamed protein product [Rotaria sp. Silwood1]|nr:unnamed protein product [Rotaria sp. Silwood1]
MQRIMVNNHTWEVPDEPGWEEVIRDATAIQELLHGCTTAVECRRVVEQMHVVFNSHPVSRKYLESDPSGAHHIMASIFKWG